MAHDRVQTLFEWDGLAHLAPIWAELARRMGASDRPVRKVRVTDLDARGRRTLASILGLARLPEQPVVTVEIGRLCSALELDAAGLRRVVEHVQGPLGNRAAERVADSAARAALWARAEARLGARVPRTLERLRAAGVPGGDIDAYARSLEVLADALDRLPAATPIPLPMLAWQAAADPHALDSQTLPGRTLQLAAVELAGDPTAVPDPITIRRAMLAIGVVPDRLCSTTITYGLRARPDAAVGRLFEAAVEARLPVNLSGAALDRGAPTFLQKRWLCVENPSVVEAASQARHGGPIVCTSGWPSVDCQRLLDVAREQGIELRYAGDYDPEGLVIAAWMATRYGATIAMPAAAYLAADLERAPAWGESEPSTPWDPELAVAIAEWRRIVYQEDPSVHGRLLGLLADTDP
jgi:uncharacterized protein (TIGR02679 family)